MLFLLNSFLRKFYRVSSHSLSPIYFHCKPAIEIHVPFCLVSASIHIHSLTSHVLNVARAHSHLQSITWLYINFGKMWPFNLNFIWCRRRRCCWFFFIWKWKWLYYCYCAPFIVFFSVYLYLDRIHTQSH